MTGQDGALELHGGHGPIGRSLPAGVVPMSRLVPQLLAVAAVCWPLAAAGIGVATGPVAGWIAAGWALGLLARLSRSHPRLGWPTPALLRATEYVAVIALVGSSAWTYALLATLAFHHYDIVYRGRSSGRFPPRWLLTVSGGWEGRLAVLIIAEVAGVPVAAAAVLVIVLAPLFVIEAISSWLPPTAATPR